MNSESIAGGLWPTVQLCSQPSQDTQGQLVRSPHVRSLRFAGDISSKFEESNIVWTNIDKYVDVQVNGSSSKKQILHSVSGYARPGEVTALMGPSGSGKTTLLNVLGGRALANMNGQMYMNGRLYFKSMRKKIAYVMQEDIFFTNLTVHEQLSFTCQLRLPESMSANQKAAAVDHVIDILGIKKCKDTQIMLVSGGEKKRTNIGTELLTNPSLILLDEPTSGLDSTAATSLMKTMRALAKDRMTVVMSIHQPSSQVFYSFDQLLLLADGHTVYYGCPKKCLLYLATLNFVPPGEYNPADFVMDLVNASSYSDIDFGDSGEKGSADIEEKFVDQESPRSVLIHSWDNGRVHEEAMSLLALQRGTKNSNSSDNLTALAPYESGGTSNVAANDQFETRSSASDDSGDVASGGYPTHYHTQFRVLLTRAFMNSKAQLFTFLNIFQTIALSLICGIAWYQMKRTEESIQDRGGFIFFYMVYWFFNSMFTGMMSFYPERAVLTKERAAGSYHLSAYFITKNISETPLVLALPAVFLAISYPMAGLNPSPRAFFGMFGTQLMATTCGESVGLLIGTATEDVTVGVTVATLVGLSFMLVGGYFVQNIAKFVLWFRYISPVKYSYDACIQFEFTESVECDGSGVMSQCEYQDSVSREQVFSYFGIDGSIGFNLGMLAVLAVSYRIMSYLCLRFLKYNQGRS